MWSAALKPSFATIYDWLSEQIKQSTVNYDDKLSPR